MAKKSRLKGDALEAAVAQAKLYIAEGMGIEAACTKAGISESAFRRNKDGVASGSIRADQIPPRPNGGKRAPRPLNMNSVKSLAGRISAIDERLKKYDSLNLERGRLAQRLTVLLKPKP